MSFNALNIDFYLCGGIHSKGYAPGEQTTALLQELTAILDAIWIGSSRMITSLTCTPYGSAPNGPLSGSIMSNITRKRPMI